MLRSKVFERLLLASGLMLATCAEAQLVTKPDHEWNSDPARNPVTHWHALATELLVDVGPIIDSRAFSILQAAVHDAVNGVERRYEPYTADLTSPGASLDAAVATAARDVLVALSPSHRERIESEYVAALATVPDGSAKDAGVALGRHAAQANLERRAADGVPVGPWPPSQGPITEPVYVPTGEPGNYAFTPPFDRPPLGPIALFPGWGRLTPFGIDLSHHQLRGPDRLLSRRYARDVHYLKSIGRLNGSTRTADQTEIAFFWFEPLPIWNSIANDVIRRQHLDAWEAARLLVLVQFAMADAGIACFAAKYQFQFWRPYTAIRRADEDGNRLTAAEKEWLPLLWTDPSVFPPTFVIPPIPDYPSAAAMTAAAAAEVLIRHLGDRQPFEATSAFRPGTVRRYTSFTQAVQESAMSRVYGGIHFLRAVQDGFQQGRSIGRVIGRMLPPVNR
jgi:PAP2 superfamily